MSIQSIEEDLWVNNGSTIFQDDDDVHDNNDNSTSNDVDNDSNCLRDTSDSNESSSFVKDAWW